MRRSDGDTNVADERRRIVAEYERRRLDASLERYYARISPVVNVAHEMRRRETLAVIDGIHRRRDIDVLDVGSGDGDDLLFLTHHGFQESRMAGIDLVPQSVAAASARLPSAKIIAADASNMPYEDNSFDVVLQTTVLSSVKDTVVRAAVADEMLRITRPTGAVISYDVRRVYRPSTTIIPIDQNELERLFAHHGTIDVHAAGLFLPLAGRIPLSVTIALSRAPFLRDFLFATVRKRVESPQRRLAKSA